MKTALLIFPHQLYWPHPCLEDAFEEASLIEDALFFGDTRYPIAVHKQKLWFHRATMTRYAERLRSQRRSVSYYEYAPGRQPLAVALDALQAGGCERIVTLDPTDFILARRVRRWTRARNMDLQILPNPGFLNTPIQNANYRSKKKRWYMADFYKFQRRRLDVLMEGDEPVGGRWSFDEENRKKVAKRLLSTVPGMPAVQHDRIDRDAKAFVEQRYADHPGNLSRLHYPTSHEAASQWLESFLAERLVSFGDYEDAIVQGEPHLWHGVLTPMLNVGLLRPQQVLEETLNWSAHHEIPLNSLEGFLRQLIGWREFMRATYEDLGVKMRTTNFWCHNRPIPNSFYDGSTGIDPIDDVLDRLQNHAYCHHIERLMVLGGFMFLCEFDPDEIYRWFMEMFIDAYDWVMVPNVYAMSQNADGGQITTKPYFSGSSYIRKMSHYKKGEWSDVWDGLYWRWIWNHRETLGKNPRWAMMCRTAERMEQSKRNRLISTADAFLAKLDHAGAA